MKTNMIGAGILGLLAVALSVTPIHLQAQEKSTTPAVKTPKDPQAQAAARTMPFRGRLKAVDGETKVLEIGTRKFVVTSETKIAKADKPATLTDAIVGETVSGAYRQGADGKLIVTTMTLGPKTPTAAAPAKREPTVKAPKAAKEQM